ncbi:type IX secretion system sortase PorU [Pontibacter oryzae]|uniref:T9SS C-terminal target domain-containing protein n=1 Tax=Pontibacter oryzae TaxID=2304593 RepID=A0A399SJR9_9BACT|nr:type IX secretion system sortase PorU [Pontibacter oryzae]RIJ43159.1 T9SS C-terminal target domain-containing protein [Pontibacter oryzae]
MMWPKRLAYACALFLLSLACTAASAQTTGAASGGFASGSVLGSGDWYKLAVTSSGIYKIDRSVLQALGINTQSIDPKKIQLFGNGGGMLPQPNSTPRPDDLQENAITVVGEADGKFDDADYVLFYAKGPHTWNYDATQKQFRHELNIYSDTAFYFLRINHSPGARMTNRAQATGAQQTITSYNERLFYEKELKNMVFSGRDWYGEEFSAFQASREFTFQASDAVAGSEVKLTAALMANSPTDCSFSVALNGQTLGSQSIPNRGSYNYHPEGVNSTKTYTTNQQQVGSGDYKATLTFGTNGSSTALGYLNYLELSYERQLKMYGEQTAFRSVESINQPVSTFALAGTPAGISIWDVTNPLQVVAQEHNSGTFSTSTDLLREFVAFQAGSISSKPVVLGKVANQNLHSLNSSGTLDFVIVTYPGFVQEANRLAAHRAQHSNMQVAVVTTTQIYNEFSSGAQDVTAIRDFMRMLYSRSNKPSGDVMYLLLFGDASYDYKNRIRNNTNFVPIYESRQSLHPITSYSSEDYYGFLDENEGEWAENALGDHLMDIGIGRLPAKSAPEAAVMVNKIIAYDSPAHFGNWRNRITLVADDGDYNEHQNDAEFLADYLIENHPKYNPTKVYTDLYQQQAVANGQRVPDATAAIDKAVEQGSLILNYTGHGNEVSWASEQILTMPQIYSWKNKNKYTFMLTATCEFGRYDDPGRPSGAETALLHAEGGAIGLITTTRPVYSNSNRVLNRNFYQTAFAPINGRMPRLGDLVRLTKNNSITSNSSGSTGVNNRNFSLLADPSMQLAYPVLEAQLTSINNRQNVIDTLSALGKVTLAGQIQDAGGSIASNFAGTLHLKVYEKPTILYTLGDENGQKVPVKVRENIIYDGKATVNDGLFEISFVVPKDIAYNFGQGKISMYASNDTQDALGSNQEVIIGGTSKTAPSDNEPPSIKLFMDDESFVSGGLTGQTTTLLAKLFDDNGINTAGIGIGHEITAVLDNDQANLVALNDYYTSAPNSYQAGEIQYTLKNLTPGPHNISLKAWDTHNNSAEAYIEFFVSNDAQLALEHVLNYPNPFASNTTFQFDHNRAGENLAVQVQIFTISGQLVKTLHSRFNNSTARVNNLTWDGLNEHNDVLPKGVYVYRVLVQSEQDGAKASKVEKLIIIN